MEINRKTNIEILRIISMIMIVAHHYVFYGVQQNYNLKLANVIFVSGSIINKFFCYMLLPGGAVGVGVFFILAGYFGINSDKVRVKKLMFIILFYFGRYCILFDLCSGIF